MSGIIDYEIISSEIIKPSYPTPSHLKVYKLSMFDRLADSWVVPFLLYFPCNSREKFAALSGRLKDSLSVALTRFYPLAGRISEDGGSINCDRDVEGVPFKVFQYRSRTLSDLYQEYGDNLSNRLYTLEEKKGDGDLNTFILRIKLYGFACGRVAISTAFLHKALDGSAMAYFLKSWAHIAGGCNDVVSPNYILSCLFPDDTQEEVTTEMCSLDKMVKYVFDRDAISSLQSKCGERVSRVMAVCAVILKCFMAASPNESMLVSNIVNLRRRAQPPLSEDCFGNLFTSALAHAVKDDGTELGFLAKKLRGSVTGIDGEYVGRMMGENGADGYRRNVKTKEEYIADKGEEMLFFTSWCGFGLYDLDFGFGSLGWFSLARLDFGDDDEMIGGRLCTDGLGPYLNHVWLGDGQCGGVEALVTIGDDHFPAFDGRLKLEAAAVTRNPNPFHY
ncbi:hypothetical protein M569_08702 [Genlisea aurea]|uniref:Uncharacterized protein n=1 Tax=Genlisea aurea TaxID=192259 RepID=S8CGV7_9LAMI|nr:hypothetical protein M569_08702 [Genlisea aurea]